MRRKLVNRVVWTLAICMLVQTATPVKAAQEENSYVEQNPEVVEEGQDTKDEQKSYQEQNGGEDLRTDGETSPKDGWIMEEDLSAQTKCYRKYENNQLIEKWVLALNADNMQVWQKFLSEEIDAQPIPLEEGFYYIGCDEGETEDVPYSPAYLFATGVQAVNTWVRRMVDEIEYYSFFDENGQEERRTGLQTIDGKQYYLTEGIIAKNKTVTLEDGYKYVFGEDGSFIKQYMPVEEQWIQNKTGKWYQYEDGTWPENCCQVIEDQLYVFDARGYLRTGTWTKLGSNWYYSRTDGTVMTSNWYKIKNKWYFMNDQGEMQSGWTTVWGKTYWLGGADDGAMRYGWVKLDGKWYYFGDNNNDGALKTGWKKISGKWYYLNPNKGGAMYTSWLLYKDHWYYLNGNGAMATGWLKSKNHWYYLDPNQEGIMATGWEKVSGKWYYLSPENDGIMVTGWQEIGDYKYYFYTNGAMATKDVVDGVYLDSNGHIKENPTTKEYWVFPCPSITRVSSEFGYRSSPGGIGSTNHKGVDMAAPANSRILAVDAGTVIAAGYDSSRGNYVQLRHENGLCTIYMHMISRPPVSTGQKVARAQVIGYVGTTGASTGNHLHFGVSVDGTYVNPWNYLARPSGV